MNADAQVIKAICRQIRARLGSNSAAALSAGVSPGVFSTYCSDDHPETLIPITRLKIIANRAEKAALIEWLTKDDDEPGDGDIVTEACEVTEAAAGLQGAARRATADRKLTPLELRGLRGQAVSLIGAASDVVVALAEQPLARRA